MRIIYTNLLVLALLAVSVMQASDVVYRVRNELVHRIDPRLFGQFMERPSWGETGPEGAIIPGTNRLQPEVQHLLREMEISLMRFPGGTDVDFIDWRDMVSNAPGRGKDRPVSKISTLNSAKVKQCRNPTVTSA